MRLNKSKRTIAIAMWFVVMLALPTFIEIYYATLYYAGVILLIPITVYRIVWDDKFEKKFYESWHKAKEQGFWINVVREGLRTVVIITAVVTISQFLVNDRSPLYIVSRLSSSVLIWLVLLLLGFGLMGGIAAWHENNKKYYRIHYSMKNNNK